MKKGANQIEYRMMKNKQIENKNDQEQIVEILNPKIRIKDEKNEVEIYNKMTKKKIKKSNNQMKQLNKLEEQN